MVLSASERPAPPARDVAGRPAVRAAAWLTWVLAGLVACATLAGLLVDGLYAGDEATAAMLRAYDLVTVLTVVPGLAVAARLAERGSAGAHLVVASLVAYVVYTYAYYLFGTGFNDLFLLHAAAFCLGLVALGLWLVTVDAATLAAALGDRFAARTRVRATAAILGVLSAALGGMWIYLAVDNAVTGDVPAGSQLVETDLVVHLGMALDLVVLVPLYAAASVLLWRREPWGFALGVLALVPGVLHQVGYLVAMPFQVAADVPGAVATDPAEPVIVALYLVGAALLLSGGRRTAASTAA